MKKVVSIVSIIVFLILIGVSMPYVFAQGDTSKEISTKAGEVGEDTLLVEETVIPLTSTTEYQLPFPGILPDHPLYFLKRLRDNILETLISDPLRKAEFYVLQGDKRLEMGLMLTDQNKNALAESTISKGEKYLEQAVTYVQAQKAKGSLVPPYIVERVERSLQKHEAVVSDLISKAQEPQKAGLTSSLDLVKKLKNEISKLK